MGIAPPFRLVLVVVVNSCLGGPASVPAFAFFIHLVQVAQDVVWRMLCRPSSLADALPPLSCWLLIASGGCFAVLVRRSGGCFATFEFGDP